MEKQIVMICGSRDLSEKHSGLVSSVVAVVRAGGAAWFTASCGRGASAFARLAFRRQGITSFSVFAASAFPASSFRASLAVRAAACVRASSVVVAFLARPGSVGTLAEMRLGVSLGFPVFAFPCSFSPSLLPSLVGAGSWRQPAGALGALGAWRWYPALTQSSLEF